MNFNFKVSDFNPSFIPNYSDKNVFYYDKILQENLDNDIIKISKFLDDFYRLVNNDTIKRAENHFSHLNLKDKGPQIGEFLNFSGRTFRFVQNYDYKESIQIYADGSFYFYGDGLSYSGSCGDVFKVSDFSMYEKDVTEGNIWFFDRNRAAGNNGIHAKIPFRTWFFNN